MKSIVLGLSILSILVLDWAALHDILKGNEPDYSLEYTTLAVSALVFGPMIVSAWRRKSKGTLANQVRDG